MNTISTNNSSSANNPIAQLIGKVIDKYDTNNDKKLNADEFGSFLNGLLGGSGLSGAVASDDDVTGTGNIDTTGTPNTTEATPRETPKFAPTAANFTLMHGFAATNYYDAGVETMKYTFARIAADYDPKQPGALDKVFNDPRFKAAFPNAQLVGHDSIDFGGQLSEGDGTGVPVFKVDVGETFATNRSGNAWQWLDTVNG
jgi:hypothetical protein